MNIEEAAKAAGFREKDGTIRTMHSSGAWVAINDELERFAKIIRNQALEEAAKRCDERKNAGDAGALLSARAIRAMKEQT